MNNATDTKAVPVRVSSATKESDTKAVILRILYDFQATQPSGVGDITT